MVSYALLSVLFVGPLGIISAANAAVDSSYPSSVATLWGIKMNAPELYLDRVTVEAQRLAQEALDDPEFGMGLGVSYMDYGMLTDFYMQRLNEAISAKEAHQHATCTAANADWNNKNCQSRRLANRPSHDFDILFNFLRGGLNNEIYNFLRPSLRQFNQALWDDVSGNTWLNFYEYANRMKADCDTLEFSASSVICKGWVNDYFGQITGSGIEGWETSRAAGDVYSNRFGQACTSLAAVRYENHCQ